METRYISRPICNICKHFCLNYGYGTGSGCKAFPDGIPDEAKCKHSSIIPGQVGEYVFEKVTYEELPEGTKWLWDKARELGHPFIV